MKSTLPVLVVILIFAVLFALKSLSFEYGGCMQRDYEMYKKNFLASDGRVLDPDWNLKSTSKAQAYMMLRCVLAGDDKTFRKVRRWTFKNLQREDKLFVGTWSGDLKNDDEQNFSKPLSSADVDIAMSLFLAYEKWRDSEYLADALLIINSIWQNEVVHLGPYYLLAPSICSDSQAVEFKTESISPYAFRLFQKYDRAHGWGDLIDSSYLLLSELCTKTETGLPSDYFVIKDSKVQLLQGAKSDFSPDGARVFGRVYLDFVFNKDHRAVSILQRSKFFISQWQKYNKIFSRYSANGEILDRGESIGEISILIPVINLYDEQIAKEIYDDKLAPLFEKNIYWKKSREYFGETLLWFGCYLYRF